jgi:hypothetical protein
MQQSLHIAFVQAVDRANLPQLVLAQERHPFTGRAKGDAALGNGADEGSVGDLRGAGAGRGCVDITGGVTAGGNVGVGGRGGVSG